MVSVKYCCIVTRYNIICIQYTYIYIYIEYKHIVYIVYYTHCMYPATVKETVDVQKTENAEQTLDDINVEGSYTLYEIE